MSYLPLLIFLPVVPQRRFRTGIGFTRLSFFTPLAFEIFLAENIFTTLRYCK